MISLTTDRLRLRQLNLADAPFILELLNDPDWIRYIGDRGIRDLDAACRYIEEGPTRMYAAHGMGLLAVELRDGGPAMGLCGLLRRDSLPDADLGFAFLPRYRSKGYALEASRAVLEHGRRSLGLSRVLAIVLPANHDSVALLRRLGMERREAFQMPNDPDELDLYAIEFPAPSVGAAALAPK